ncbi:MAG: DNA translocase FtsK 4TM domain-containing protein, partial [Flavobacterium sp.]
MAGTKKKKETSNIASARKKFQFTERHQLFLGILLLIFSIAMAVSFVSYFLNWQTDQSAIGHFSDRAVKSGNWLGKVGSELSHFFLYKGFGIASFLLVKLVFLTGLYFILKLPTYKLKNIWFWDLFAMVFFSLLFGFFHKYIPGLGGVIGYEMNLYFEDFAGSTGTILILFFGVAVYLIFKIEISPEKVRAWLTPKPKTEDDDFEDEIFTDITTAIDNTFEDIKPTQTFEKESKAEPLTSIFEVNKEALKPTIQNPSEIKLDVASPIKEDSTPEIIKTDDNTFVIEKATEEETVDENLAAKLVADF